MKKSRLVFSIFMAMLVYVPCVQATTIIDFEAPTYVAGALNGQDGWTANGAVVAANSDIGGGTNVLDFSGNVGSRITASRNLDADFSSGMVSVYAKVKWTYDKIGFLNLFDTSGNLVLAIGGSKTTAVHFLVNGGTAGYLENTAMPETSSGLRFIELHADINLDTNVADVSWSEVGGAKTVLFSNYALYDRDLHSLSVQNSKAASMFDNITITPVPEPATMLLLGIGCLGSVIRRRR